MKIDILKVLDQIKKKSSPTLSNENRDFDEKKARFSDYHYEF